MLADATDADVFALAEDELEAAVQVFHVRGGRVRGQRGWVVEKEAEDTAEVVEHLLQQVYGGEAGPRRCRARCSCPCCPPTPTRSPRGSSACAAARVDLRVPQRGDKRALMETVRRNAEQSPGPAQGGPRRRPDRPQPGAPGAAGHPGAATTRRCGSSASTSATSRAPTSSRRWSSSRTACRASPSTAGSSSAARSTSRARCATDDTAAMHEVLTRRFRRYLDDASDATDIEGVGSGAPGADDRDDVGPGRRDDAVAGPADRPRHRAPAPVRLPAQPRRRRRRPAAGQRRPRRRSTSSASTTSPLVGLAKRLEEVWLPGQEFPVILPRTSEGLYLLQRLRDEAHRFAITFHRQRRSKAMTTSPARRHPGPGRDAAQGAAASSSVRSSGSGPPRSTRSRPCPASGRRWPRPLRHTLAAGRRTACRPSTSRPAKCSTTKERAVPIERAVADDRAAAAAAVPPVPRSTDFVIVTGMSGAGRVDGRQRPRGPRLVRRRQPAAAAAPADGRAARRARARRRGATSQVAAVVDVRGRGFFAELAGRARRAARRGLGARSLIFLDATDEALVRRFESVRRPHPLQGDGPAARRHPGASASCCATCAPRPTSSSTPPASTCTSCGQAVRSSSPATGGPRLRIAVMSFGFKYGMPLDADFVFDMRFLPNPYWVPELRPKSGRDPPVADYVLRPGGRRRVPRPGRRR